MKDRALMTAVAVVTLLLCACTDSTTFLKNEATGEIVTCGGRHPVTVAESAVQRREAQCIQDYKERGFVRVSGPKSN